ncbi:MULTISPECIES: OB-fold domain-containing protein [Rhodococcus]|jgi:hydroxymethylglutaryl-CoA synthase|uniref:OB-fold domain-containing protein n=1 Tax=Rhodococcus qingshengii JCM 15477 TaxID=1303681 RepID=A0AB38RML4_RHOSG|nr:MULTISPECIES: OB-fold domain-containing protein [Rhodococcus]ANQ75863.1 hydroxymethylglutaryl-CoA synthase [Rhodococcus sp. 008]KSU69293.1 hydroxymethylglutaryl-CoA synthase [Rhodococcus qingshengii]MDA3635211.1 OB-fold domain-containing protein [Rhodococcus sp. C-2]UPU46447.1 OB-fold domain-containing protein [Rhodococcus qingshengii JCM 15477]SCC66619.1 3-hydroxy-3-methylglutaryl CoA synthase [Rhodococcus qingshengii]
MTTQRLGITSYGTYLPRHRVSLAEIASAGGASGGRGERVAASFDEDSTTMAVEAARAALAGGTDQDPRSLYLATTSPAYADKTNAVAVHAALGLDRDVFAADIAGSARGTVAALLTAGESGGLAVLSDVITGRPGSADERSGGDGAAAFVFGSAETALATVLARASLSEEFLDRWRVPGAAAGSQWEERFGLERYLPLIAEVAKEALAKADIGQVDHVVVVSPNSGVTKRAAKLLPAVIGTTGSPIGYAGAAGLGLALADVLDRAEPGQSILLISAADGADALVLRTTDRILQARQSVSVANQLDSGRALPYFTYLNWRGLLDREPPRRPEPDWAAAPPSARALGWKFNFAGTRCSACSFLHLPPARVCKGCGAVDKMIAESLAPREGSVATYTVDRLAFSPSPPVVDAVVNFDGGGRYTLEVADSDAETLRVGARVGLTFRRLGTTSGVHNYFWKAKAL